MSFIYTFTPATLKAVKHTKHRTNLAILNIGEIWTNAPMSFNIFIGVDHLQFCYIDTH